MAELRFEGRMKIVKEFFGPVVIPYFTHHVGVASVQTQPYFSLTLHL